MTAYLSLIQEDAGIQHEDELVQAFNKLADQVHPLALGNVKRSLSQSRMMVRKLLSLHMDRGKEAHQVDEIVDNLTSKLYYHGHPINRTEARQEIGLATIENPSPEVEQWMWQLYEEYEHEIKMEEPFQPAMEFVAQFPNLQSGETKVSGLTTAKLAFVESVCRTDVHSVDYELIGQKTPDGVVHAFPNIRRQSWVSE